MYIAYNDTLFKKIYLLIINNRTQQHLEEMLA